MWTKDSLLNLARETGVDIHVWGFSGDEAVQQIERDLGCRFPDSIRAFGSSVGNVSIGPFGLIITGNRTPQGETSSVWLTAQAREFAGPAAANLVVIGRMYEVLYCWVIGAETIQEYAELERDLPLITRQWATFEAFLETMIPEMVEVMLEFERQDDEHDL